MAGQGMGYICVLVACISFGSNFVPAKKVDIKDGQFFTFMLSVGIALVGLVQWLTHGMYKFEPLAMIGGATWATANLFVPFIIKRCGLGLGQLGWCVTNMLTGWATGAFGLFGIAKSSVTHPGLNYFGVALNVCALLVITQMGKSQPADQKKLLDTEAAVAVAVAEPAPQMKDPKDAVKEMASLRRRLRACGGIGGFLLLVLAACACVLIAFPNDENLKIAMVVVMAVSVLAMAPVGVYMMMTRAQISAEDTGAPAAPAPAEEGAANAEHLSTSFVVQTPASVEPAVSGGGFLIGLLVSMAAGVLMGCNFDVPTLLQQAGPSKGHSSNPLDYVFSHYMGILALTSCYFFGYKASVKDCYVGREIVLPGLVSGIMWGIAQVCWFVANDALSFAISFPMITGVPGVLALVWGMVLFGENRDPRSLKLLAVILMFSASSLACIAASH